MFSLVGVGVPGKENEEKVGGDIHGEEARHAPVAHERDEEVEEDDGVEEDAGHEGQRRQDAEARGVEGVVVEVGVERREEREEGVEEVAVTVLGGSVGAGIDGTVGGRAESVVSKAALPPRRGLTCTLVSLHTLIVRQAPFPSFHPSISHSDESSCSLGPRSPRADGRLDPGGVLPLNVLLEDEVQAVAKAHHADGQHLWVAWHGEV